jgi:hypothetical protein
MPEAGTVMGTTELFGEDAARRPADLTVFNNALPRLSTRRALPDSGRELLYLLVATLARLEL